MVEHNREYPAMARQQGLQGTVTVRVAIRGDGSIAAVTVASSSGHKGLDKAAVSAVRRSAPFKPPAGFGLGEVTVEIPIVYRLT
jgi:protein TonB